MKRRITIYSIYDKEDEILFVGTAKECGEYLGRTTDNFYTLVTKTRRGYYKGNRYKAYRVGREDKKNKGDIIL